MFLPGETGEAMPSGLYPMGFQEPKGFRRFRLLQELLYETLVSTPKSISHFANTTLGSTWTK